MKWSDEEIKFLVENSEKLKRKVIAEKLGKAVGAVSAKHFKLGLKRCSDTRQSNEFNENFFKEISPLTCYFAGLIASDGSIDSKRNKLSFYQNNTVFIEYFKKCLKSNNKIYYRWNNGNTHSYSIMFTSKSMVEDIKSNFNIFDRKSENGLKIPNILDLDCIMCYVAGLIDGDGSISLKKDRLGNLRLHYTLLASLDILNWINESLKLKNAMYKRKDCAVELYNMHGSHNKAFKFLEPIYDCLARNDIQISKKWEKVHEHKLFCSDK